ncbi:MAG: HlyC/CorC family transporter [Planctomycetes bacterium]|nr:HlyC/CorC family transporter [Planctomycetota bacterium]
MLTDLLYLLTALLLVAVNGYFVAVEFALIKTRPARLEQLVLENRAFAKTASWLMQRLDASLAACQLGITMASLALGWVGEPAFARLVEPLLAGIGVESAALIHGIGFAIAFSLITALHLVAGEQVPKILAIRTAERLALPLAPPLKVFYVLTYPLLVGLSATTSMVLKLFGVRGVSEHDSVHTEDEIRALMRQARVHGELSRTEDRLIHAVFEFDDMICRRVMMPRVDIVWVDVDATFEQCLEVVRQSKHSRYPVCDGSLDRVVGVLHMKDLVQAQGSEDVKISDLMRPPRNVPEAMPISKLLRHFQTSHQHLAFVVDEHGTVTGLVTLENVIEQIVGPVEDEFDSEEPAIVPQEHDEFLIRGSASVTEVSRRLGVELVAGDADTMSGLLTEVLQRVPEVGDVVDVQGLKVEVLEVVGTRAMRMRVRLPAARVDDGAEAGGAATENRDG